MKISVAKSIIMVLFMVLVFCLLPVISIAFTTLHYGMTSSSISVGSGSTLASGTTQVGFGGIRWYVVGFNGTGINKGAGTVTLLSKAATGSSAFTTSTESGAWNDYQGSDLQTSVNSLLSSFDAREQAVMAGLTLDGVDGAQPTNQKIWAMSGTEASAVSQDVCKLSNSWWLRSLALYNTVGYVQSDGTIGDIGMSATSTVYSVRPGTAINLVNVLYAAPIAGAKGATIGTMNSVALGSEIKFTILDNTNLGLAIASAPASLSKAQGETISLNFSGAHTGTDKYVSCVLVSQTDNLVKYYAKLSTAAGDAISIPTAGVQPGSYTLLIYNEQISSGDNSDYASTPVSINLTVSGSTNTAPALRSDVPSTASASVSVNSAYTLNLSTIFVDPDGNPLTYRVYINGSGSAVSADTNYSFTPTVAGITTLRFTAYDGAAESPPYTVTLTAANVLTTGITVTAENGATAVGQNGQLQLYYTVQPSNATNKAVTWTTSFRDAGPMATGDVDAGNMLRLNNISLDGITDAYVTVRATAQDGSGIHGELTLDIISDIVTGISVTAANEDLAAGDATQMTAIVSPANAKQWVKWSISSGSGIASVSSTGQTSGHLSLSGSGTVTVRATASDGSSIYGEKTLTVKALQNAPPAPILVTKTASLVLLCPIAGTEYSMDGMTWQSDTTFTGLAPYTTYDFYARKAGTDTLRVSPSSPALSVTTYKAALGGTVSITGTFKLGQDLTADTSGLTATPDCSLGTLSCQWTRNGAAISGATGDTYCLVADDFGKVINVTVSAENCTGSISSGNTAVMAKADPDYTVPDGLAAVYGDTMANVKLPDGFTWEVPSTTSVGEPGIRSFKVTYTPDDTTCYNIITHISVTVTVNKATPVITAPAASSITYGEPLSHSTLSGGTESVAGSFAWTDGTIQPSAADSNNTEYSVTFTPTDKVHYNTINTNVTLTVDKAIPYVTKVPSATAISYGQTLSDSILSGGNANVPGSFAWTDGTTKPIVFDGNTTASYSATFTPTDTANYYTVTTSVEVIVNKATPDINLAPAASAITYGQTLSGSILTGGDASVPGSFAWTNGTMKPAVSDSDKTLYSVTFTPMDAGNYNTAVTTVKLTVNKAMPAITLAPVTSAIAYGQTLSDSILTSGKASVPGSFVWTDGTSQPAVSDSNTTAYSVTFTPTDAGNYNTAVTTVKLTVNKATPDITLAPTTSAITYEQKLSNSTLTGGDASVPGSFTWTYGITKPAVSDSNTTGYSVTFTPTDTGNYTTATTLVKLTVNKATPSITAAPTASAITCGQTLSESTLTSGTASVPGSFAWTDGTIKPAESDSETTAYSVTFTPMDTANYNTAATTVTLTVGKATPSITAVPFASAITYGQTLADSTLSGGMSSVEGSFSWEDETIAPTVFDSDTTEYSVIFTPTDTANYNMAATTVKLTVGKATPSITAVPSASAITYGQTLAESTLTGGTASIPGSFSWTDDATKPAVSDSSRTAYSVTFTPTDAGNYDTVTTTVKLRVNKATPSITVTASADSVRFKDRVTLTANIVPQNTASQLTGSVKFRIGSVSYGTTYVVPVPGDTSGAVRATIIVQVSELPGNYTVTASFTSTNPNYKDNTGSLPLTVTARDASPYYSTGFYTGDMFAWTTGSNSNTATVTLAAVIKDNNIPSGDVRTAKVTFYLFDSSKLTPISGAKGIPVSLINKADGTIGIASAVVHLDIGKSNSQGFIIAVGISGGYTNDPFSTISDTIVTVAKPIHGGRILGGGDITNIAKSAGIIKGADSGLTHFTFDVSYNNKQTNPAGRVQIIVRSCYMPNGVLDSALHEYIITGNSISLLKVIPPTATFSSQATLAEKKPDGTIISISSGLTLQMTLTEGKKGSAGNISITLNGSKSAGGLWYSNSWNPSTGKSYEEYVNSGSEVNVQ